MTSGHADPARRRPRTARHAAPSSITPTIVTPGGMPAPVIVLPMSSGPKSASATSTRVAGERRRRARSRRRLVVEHGLDRDGAILPVGRRRRHQDLRLRRDARVSRSPGSRRCEAWMSMPATTRAADDLRVRASLATLPSSSWASGAYTRPCIDHVLVVALLGRQDRLVLREQDACSPRSRPPSCGTATMLRACVPFRRRRSSSRPLCATLIHASPPRKNVAPVPSSSPADVGVVPGAVALGHRRGRGDRRASGRAARR